MHPNGQMRVGLHPRPDGSQVAIMCLWSHPRWCGGGGGVGGVGCADTQDKVERDLTRHTLPASMNEPLSLLQRTAEDMRYSGLLDQACARADARERLVSQLRWHIRVRVKIMGMIIRRSA
jgi:hypothetical protein